MTGHHHDKQSRGTNPLRIETPDLNTQAARLAQTRENDDPHVRDLAAIEPKFIAELLRRLDTVDHTLIGAVLLAAGQLASQILSLIPPEQRINGGPVVSNLLQLAGQQLYHGKMAHVTACPFPLATGKPCDHIAKAETGDQLNAVMRGHIALHHPDQTWPVTEPQPTEATAYCACGNPADLIVDITNRPNGQPGEAKAICNECHQRGAQPTDG